MDKGKFGDRMKQYEKNYDQYFIQNMPILVRVDARSFHTFTKGFDKPFSNLLINLMNLTAKRLCKEVAGCKIAYVQSDEITLLLIDYGRKTEQWFGGRRSKIESLSASIATLAFNEAIYSIIKSNEYTMSDFTVSGVSRVEFGKLCDNLYNENQFLESKLFCAMFDSRAWQVPEFEVNNVFLWRQRDCETNSIQMVGQSNYKHKELDKLSCKMIQNKLFTELGINWNELETYKKRGRCIIKESCKIGDAVRTRWIVDNEIPIFSQDRDYINKYLTNEEA